MAKQKNDVISENQQLNKRLQIAAFCCWCILGLLYMRVTSTDNFPISNVNDLLDEEIRLPQQAETNASFCIYIDSLLDDHVFDVPYEDYFYPQGNHSLPSLKELSEWKINGIRVPPEQITWELFDTYPSATVLHICYPQGLGQGVYDMEFRLIDPTYVIYTCQWVLTVN